MKKGLNKRMIEEMYARYDELSKDEKEWLSLLMIIDIENTMASIDKTSKHMSEVSKANKMGFVKGVATTVLLKIIGDILLS